MATSVQYQQPASHALPPKQTRQRYRRETDDLDPVTRGHVDPYDYNDYPSGSTSANTAAARQSPHNSVPRSPDAGPSAPPAIASSPNDVSRTTRQRPPSYESSTEQLSRGGYSGERRRPQTSSQGPSYNPVPPPAQAPAGSRNMAGSALLRQTQAQQSSSQARPVPSQGYAQASQSPKGPSPKGPSQPRQTAAQAAGASIARLKTPSVMESVLQPLGTKVQEYDRLMQEAQEDMKRLDEELRVLQQRRDDAEDRFLDAEARHKEWQQQYDGVRRTLNGEAPVASPVPPMPQQAKAKEPQPIHDMRHLNDLDDDDEDDDDNEPVYKRPWSMNHQSSFTSTKSKGRRSRLLSSIFGIGA